MEKTKKRDKEKKMKDEISKLFEKEKILKRAAKILRVREEDLPRVLERFLREIKEMELKLAQNK